jgi:hypothetical protein
MITPTMFFAISLIVQAIAWIAIVVIVSGNAQTLTEQDSVQRSEYMDICRVLDGMSKALKDSFEKIDKNQMDFKAILHEFCAEQSRYARDQMDLCQQEKVWLKDFSEHVRSYDAGVAAVKQELVGKMEEFIKSQQAAAQATNGPSIPNVGQFMEWMKYAEQFKDKLGPWADFFETMKRSGSKTG